MRCLGVFGVPVSGEDFGGTGQRNPSTSLECFGITSTVLVAEVEGLQTGIWRGRKERYHSVIYWVENEGRPETKVRVVRTHPMSLGASSVWHLCPVSGRVVYRTQNSVSVASYFK